MAFNCRPTVNHTQINGHHCFLQYSRTGQTVSSAKTIQKHQNHFTLMWGRSTPALKFRFSSHEVLALASSEKSVQENSSDSKEETSDSPTKQTTQLSGSEAPSSSPGPFVGAKISSRIAARTSEAANNTVPASATPPPMKSRSSEVTSPGSMPSIFGVEKLKTARTSPFLELRPSSKESASKNVLDALKRADLGGKTTKFGQPMVPTNLFDEPRMLPPEKKKFEFTLNAGQLVLVFSFLTIIAVMFGTAFVVWKLGAIHYDEY